MGGKPHKACRDENAEGGEGQRRGRRDPVAGETRVETALEQDDGKRHAADQEGGRRVVEADSADAVHSGGQSDAKENQK